MVTCFLRFRFFYGRGIVQETDINLVMILSDGNNVNISVISGVSDILSISDSDLYPSYMSLENYSDWCQDNTSFGSFSGDEQDRLVAFWVEGVMVPMVGGMG